MKFSKYIALLTVVVFAISPAQLRRYAIHSRGMLHQTVYNTGEIGRPYDDGSTGSTPNIPSFEWPGNSSALIDGTLYDGQYNSFGAGFYVFATKNLDSSKRYTDMCGALSDEDGNAGIVEDVYSKPVSLQRIENFSLNSDGTLNTSYNPDEAEEKIISKWKTVNTGLTVTRTSRAWSYPDYDDFVIYEYEIENTSPDTLTDMIIAWGYSFAASLFANQRELNRWSETDFRGKDQFARFDLKRFMSYNHDRDGSPDPVYFDYWANTGKYGGGLNAPQAIGIVTLHYDYDNLAIRSRTNAYFLRSDVNIIFDNNGRGRMKQPYINRYENGNLYPSKIGNYGFLDCIANRKTGPYQSSDQQYVGSYWVGRARPSWSIGSRQPVGHIYGFGPYTLLPNQKMSFALAEVAGFGAGNAEDSIYTDVGGGSGSDGTEPEPGMHRIPSWYSAFYDPYSKTLNSPSSTMGSNYLQNHPLPSYVNSNVVSIRDVADRAIQAYSGYSLVKYDTVQFEPEKTPENGVYKFPIPFPSPVIRVEDSEIGKNKISWSSAVEAFSSPRLRAGLSYYEVLRTDHPTNRWVRVDSVGIKDTRYFQMSDSTYSVYDKGSSLLESYYYAVVSVDSLGKKSGTTNITLHETQLPSVETMTKVYAVPNPLVITSGYGGGSTGGDVNDRIGFFGLPKRATIRIFSYSGQLINTIEHNANLFSISWYQITRNTQKIASGVYFFTVDDDKGNRVHGKFVVIH